MKFNLPKNLNIVKKAFLAIGLFLTLFFTSNNQALTASIFKVEQPTLNIKDNQAEFSFYLTNLSSSKVFPKGYVEVKNQAGAPIFQKEINYQKPLNPNQTDKVSFYWEPNLKSLGRLQAKIVLKDASSQQTQQEKFSFLVLPNILGGMAALSIVLLGGRGVLKVTRLFIV